MMRIRQQRFLAPLTVALAALVLAGCDDDDSRAALPTPSVTATGTAVPSATAAPSSTPAPTSTPSPQPTLPIPSSTATASRTVTHSATPAASATAAATDTPASTATVTATATPSFAVGSCFDPEVQASEPLCALDVDPQPCDFLMPESCLLPYPSSYFLEQDDSTATGLRVNYRLEAMPVNARQVHIDPTEINTLDGFSPAGMIITLFPEGIDLTASNVAPIDAVERSLAQDSPTVIIDADSGERILHFGELDMRAPDDATRAFILRPEVRLKETHRYIVALRGLKDRNGAAIAARPAFTILRDGRETPVAAINARRAHFEDIFGRLQTAGIERDDLILAWDFVVASTAAITSRAVSARDQALAANGPEAPPFEVTSIEDNYSGDIFRRVRGTFTVPLFMTKDGPGTVYNLDEDGVPRQNGTTQAPFTIIIPRSAVEGPQPVPGRPMVYGHGFLGSGIGEITSGPQQTLARRFGFIIGATDWIGLSENDVQSTLRMLSDLSKFNQLVDRCQQGFINTIFLGRLMTGANGLNSHPAFQFNGVPIIDTQQLYYSGNSQGATLGAAYLALSPDTLRGVLGVGTANYTFLLPRSVDYNSFDVVLQQHYPSALDRTLGLALVQQIADRGEPNGYTSHLVSDPLPGTPAKKVLIHTGIDDSQVSHYSVLVQVRSLGIPAVAPSAYPAFGIPEVEAPFDGSAWVPFDLGGEPLPLTNLSPQRDNGVHEAVRRLDVAQRQLDAFLRPDGRVENFCDGPCRFRGVPGVIEQ